MDFRLFTYFGDTVDQIVGEDGRTVIQPSAAFIGATEFQLAELADIRIIAPSFPNSWNYTWTTGTTPLAGEAVLGSGNGTITINSVDSDGTDREAEFALLRYGTKLQLTRGADELTATVLTVTRTVTGNNIRYSILTDTTTNLNLSGAGQFAVNFLPEAAITRDQNGRIYLAPDVTAADVRALTGAITTDDITPANIQQGGC